MGTLTSNWEIDMSVMGISIAVRRPAHRMSWTERVTAWWRNLHHTTPTVAPTPTTVGGRWRPIGADVPWVPLADRVRTDAFGVHMVRIGDTDWTGHAHTVRMWTDTPANFDMGWYDGSSEHFAVVIDVLTAGGAELTSDRWYDAT